MGYLVSQIWLCLLIAAVIGGIIGWLLRGGCKNKIEALEENYRARLLELERERDDLSARVTDFDAMASERDDLNSQVSRLKSIEQERDDLNARLAALDTTSGTSATTAAAAVAGVTGLAAGSSEIEPVEEITTDSSNAIDMQSSYDIEEIEGIGAGYGKRLRNSNIESTSDLLDNCSGLGELKAVADKINMEPEVVRSWTSMADLMRVQGIGGQYAELLEFSGVNHVGALSSSDADGLTLKMNEVNARENRVKQVPDTPTVKSWIGHAATLPARLSDDMLNLTTTDSISSDTMSIPDSEIEVVADAQSSYDIEEIEGIGKGYGKKLRELGIATTADILNQCPDKTSMQPVVQAMNLEDWVIRSWVSMADLMRVNGIGGQYAELLNFSDIQNIEALTKANPSGLVAKLNSVNEKENRVNEVPNKETVTGWIEQAKTLPGMLKLD